MTVRYKDIQSSPNSNDRHTPRVTRDPYRLVAHKYDKLHTRWLKYAGGEAQCAFDGAVYARIKPGIKVLDLGCGTGMLARRLQMYVGDSAEIVLLDQSAELLEHTQDISNVHRVNAPMEHIPIANNEFDLVTSSWALEATRSANKAVHEMVRVAKPGGFICVVFCAEICCQGVASRLMQKVVQLRQTGKFLEPEFVIESFLESGVSSVRRIPCSGPAVALVIEV